jgi:hypothetical protein
VSDERKCGECGEDFPSSQHRCPHCGRPSLFPNVYDAERESERQALEDRYQQALVLADQAGARSEVDRFEDAVRRNSKAVLCLDLTVVQQRAKSNREPFATYYQLVRSGARLPSGEKWDVLRHVAEEALFPGYKDEIHFAALALNGIGVTNYGNCSLTLREDRTAHRATVFEANNVVFTVYEQQTKIADAIDLPPGFRATWKQREKLCVAKLAARIGRGTHADSFPGILLEPGESTDDDDFLEVHICGPMTIRTVERVVVIRKRIRNRLRPTMAAIRDLQETLEPFGIPVEYQAE